MKSRQLSDIEEVGLLYESVLLDNNMSGEALANAIHNLMVRHADNIIGPHDPSNVNAEIEQMIGSADPLSYLSAAWDTEESWELDYELLYPFSVDLFEIEKEYAPLIKQLSAQQGTSYMQPKPPLTPQQYNN